MRWLADGVPITLLCDLATYRDPESQTINLSERPPGDLLRGEADVQLADYRTRQHQIAL
jgi:hypothetical protein